MKKIIRIITIMVLITGFVFAAIPLSNRTWIRVGSLQSQVDAWGAERAWDANRGWYEGLLWPAWYARTDNFVIDRPFIACRNFNAPGDYKAAKFSTGASATQIIPQVLEQTALYPYTDITVDGRAQYVADYINGNYHTESDSRADRVVTNVLRTGLGVTVTRKLYAFSQQYNDNYFIIEYIFENTGQTDDTGNINRTATIEDFYYGRITRYATSSEVNYITNLRQNTWGAHQWVYHTPMIDDPDMPYYYSWMGQAQTADITMNYDNVGGPYLPAEGSIDRARIRCPQFAGEGVIHADKSWDDESHDKSKVRLAWYIGDGSPPEGADQQAWGLLSNNYDGRAIFDVPQDVYADHKIADRLAPYTTIKDKDAAGTNGFIAFGPYNIPHGESVKVVVVQGVSGLSRRKATEVGKKWYRAYNGNTVDLDLPSPPEHRDPEAIDPEAAAMDVYKNMWVYTGKDSIVQTFLRARDNYTSGFGIPMPPPPPVSFNVIPQPDQVLLEWADNAEQAPNFEGYRVYRAMLEPDSFYYPIFECSVTDDNITNSFNDKGLLRGLNYYYYVVSYSVDPELGELESGRAYTQTTIPATLKKPPKDIADDGRLISDIAQLYADGQISDKERVDAVLGMVRIVPNPYNIKNRKITYGSGSDKDKLMFYNLPANCNIRIFTERGDLVDIIEHRTMQGMAPVADVAWNSATESRQVIKSGVYIAHIQIEEDIDELETGLPLLFSGESIIKKFIIIR
jgi:hypothetical protein